MENIGVTESNTEEPIPCKKGRTGEQADRISNLPDAIVHHIFSFVSTVDVVRTSVLAKRWRYLWTQTPTLDFDDGQFHIVDGDDAFVHFVNGVHSLYKAPKIQRYRLFVGQPSNAIFVETWVHFAVQMNVMELILHMNDYGPFEMPCCRSVRDLRLDLESGGLTLPATGCYSSLETLSLSRVGFIDDTILDAISHRCPRLRSLNFKNCIGMSHLNISCPFLEELEIERCFGLNQLNVSAEKLRCLCVTDSFTYGSGLVKILAPSLQTFKWLDYIVDDFYIGTFTSLKAAHISVVIDYDPENIELYLKNAGNFLNRLAGAESLQVEMACFWGLSTQKDLLEGLPTPPRNLKHLILLVGLDDYVFRGISYLFKSLPKLETLHIRIVDEQTHELLKDRFPEASLFERGEHWNYQSPPLDHLWEVKVCGFGGREHEIEFVEFLLKNSLVLKIMIILFSSEASLDQSTKAQITHKLMELESASPNAIVTFS